MHSEIKQRAQNIQLPLFVCALSNYVCRRVARYVSMHVTRKPCSGALQRRRSSKSYCHAYLYSNSVDLSNYRIELCTYFQCLLWLDYTRNTVFRLARCTTETSLTSNYRKSTQPKIFYHYSNCFSDTSITLSIYDSTADSICLRAL